MDPALSKICKLRKGIRVEVDTAVCATHAAVNNHARNGDAIRSSDIDGGAAMGGVVPLNGREGHAIGIRRDGLQSELISRQA